MQLNWAVKMDFRVARYLHLRDTSVRSPRHGWVSRVGELKPIKEWLREQTNMNTEKREKSWLIHQREREGLMIYRSPWKLNRKAAETCNHFCVRSKTGRVKHCLSKTSSITSNEAFAGLHPDSLWKDIIYDAVSRSFQRLYSRRL